MELLNHLLADSDNFQLQNWSLDRPSHHITLKVASIQSNIQCPECKEPSHRTHSHYERTLADLPWSDYRITWQLLVRKFFCSNRDCQRRIFTERIPTVAVPWGRRTQRLAEQLAEIGLALGGAAGARLSKRVSQTRKLQYFITAYF